ncbi:MAG: hypothetical protein KGL39_42625 [Patescibacteria group bacterium]|nr:hypothetical protein [Patescibacteria group bacterium]
MRKNKTWQYQKIEFTYGFAVLYLGDRIALTSTEEQADAVIRTHKREMKAQD